MGLSIKSLKEKNFAETHLYQGAKQYQGLYAQKEVLVQQQEHKQTLRVCSRQDLKHQKKERLPKYKQHETKVQYALHPTRASKVTRMHKQKKANEELRNLSKKSETPIQRITLRSLENQEVENEEQRQPFDITHNGTNKDGACIHDTPHTPLHIFLCPTKVCTMPMTPQANPLYQIRSFVTCTF